MTKKEQTKTEQTETTEFTLSDGTKVFLKKGTGKEIIKARRLAPDSDSVQIYLAAELGTFNGQKIPAEELLELDMDDFLLMETKVRELIDTKNFRQQGM